MSTLNLFKKPFLKFFKGLKNITQTPWQLFLLLLWVSMTISSYLLELDGYDFDQSITNLSPIMYVFYLFKINIQVFFIILAILYFKLNDEYDELKRKYLILACVVLFGVIFLLSLLSFNTIFGVVNLFSYLAYIVKISLNFYLYASVINKILFQRIKLNQKKIYPGSFLCLSLIISIIIFNVYNVFSLFNRKLGNSIKLLSSY